MPREPALIGPVGYQVSGLLRVEQNGKACHRVAKVMHATIGGLLFAVSTSRPGSDFGAREK